MVLWYADFRFASIEPSFTTEIRIMIGGGIIDMMNTRLQNRMGEQEILKIFSDTVEVR